MNFRVKLTIGVMTNGKHVQYCVNKVEIKQNRLEHIVSAIDIILERTNGRYEVLFGLSSNMT